MDSQMNATNYAHQLSGSAVPKSELAGNRLLCLDAARAAAIFAMILAHFGPALFARVQALAPYESGISLLYRFATPGFVTIFGITAGFVYYEKMKRGPRKPVDSKLLNRALLLLVCTLLVKAPNYPKLMAAPDFGVDDVLYNSYTILAFYALAVGLMPLWLRLIVAAPVRMCLALGIAHWTIGWFLVHKLWPEQGAESVAGFTRFFLVSGSYGYFQLMGTALLVFPLGIAFRRAVRAGQAASFLRGLTVVGALVFVGGFGLAQAVGELSVAGIASGDMKAPPRIWYYLLYGGATICVVGVAGLAEIQWQTVRRLVYPVGLLGQAALPIYVSHFYAQPLAQFLERRAPGLGAGTDLIPLAVFAVFCVVMGFQRHRKTVRKASQSAGPANMVPTAMSGPRIGAAPAD